jgi:tryptophan 2-monooxygenase
MDSIVPSAPNGDAHDGERPMAMLVPDFPFAYGDYLASPDGLGEIPEEHHGKEVAIVGAGIAGMVAAYELMKLGLKPVIYEADRIGGRLRSAPFDGFEDVVAELGAMRFPPSARTLFHYIDLCGLETKPFPNPLTDASPGTVVDLKGETYYAQRLEDLPAPFQRVAKAWQGALEHGAQLSALQSAIRQRDVGRIKKIWNSLVPALDDVTVYGFLSASKEFERFSDRELFGQVGFGTGGWDTDFPNSILETLRLVCTGADDEHRAIVGGAQTLPLSLWERAPGSGEMAHWPVGTTLEKLNGGKCRGAVVALNRTAPGNVTVFDADGEINTFPAAVFTGQSWLLLSRVACDESLFPPLVWTALERTHYMQASKTFIVVDRPFWKDKDPETGREAMSTTLTDRMPRGTYLIDNGDDRPGVICLSLTFADDSLKWVSLSQEERVQVALQSLRQIYPNVDIRKHMIGNPLTISWETEPWFMGAFKADLPGHYRYQRRLFTHFMQDRLPPEYRGIFLAGDDISWTAGWAEGAAQTALNAVWGVMAHLGGGAYADNPGPGDRFDELAPLELPET